MTSWHNTVLLLPSCIDPQGMVMLKRQEVEARLKDHKTALKSWLTEQTCLERVVFCENSGYPLDEISDVAGRYAAIKEVEIIQFSGQDFHKKLGKGYGHLKTIDYALSHSTLISTCDNFLTVPGRYFVANADRIIHNISRALDVCCDLHSLRWADVRVMWFRKAVYESCFKGAFHSVNDSAGWYSEHVIARQLLQAISHGHSWRPLPRTPYFVGYSGTENSKLDSVPNRLKWLLKEALRWSRLVPAKRFRADG